MITRAAKRRAEEEAESNDARRRRSRSPQAGPSESTDSSSISAPSSSDIDSEIIDISDDESECDCDESDCDCDESDCDCDSDESGDITVVGEYVDLLNDPQPIEYFVNTLENYPGILQNDCGICLEKLKPDVVIFQCGHAVHASCVEELICKRGTTCPNCRAEIEECTINIRSATEYTVRSFTQLKFDHWDNCEEPHPP